MAAYIVLCILLEADRCSAGLQEAASQETEPGIRVLERGKAGRQTACPTSLQHTSPISSAQVFQQPSGMSAGNVSAGLGRRGMHRNGQEGGGKAHLFGYLKQLHDSSGVTGFMTKLHFPTEIPAVPEISTQVSTQTSLCPMLVQTKLWMGRG